MLGTETITVIPQTQADTDGYLSLVPGTSFTVTGTLVPATSAQVQQLPELARKRKSFVLYVEGTTELIKISDPTTGNPSDRIVSQGQTYVALSFLDYRRHTSGLPHTGYIVQLVAGDEV